MKTKSEAWVEETNEHGINDIIHISMMNAKEMLKDFKAIVMKPKS